MTGIENAEVFGNVLPNKMGVYSPNDFKIAQEENDLNTRLPDINRSRGGDYLNYAKPPHNNYFNPSDTEGPKSSRSILEKRKRSIPKPKREKHKGNKTARASTPSELPHWKPGQRKGSHTRRSNNPSVNFVRQDLDVTDNSLLEKAYKNILPREVEMLADDIEVRRRGSRPPSSHKTPNSKAGDKSFFKHRFKSLDPSQSGVEDESTPRLTPMQRRNKWKNKKNKSKKRKQKVSKNRKVSPDLSFGTNT